MRAQADVSPGFEVTVVADHAQVVVRVGGELDGVTAPDLRHALVNAQAALDGNIATQPLVVDVSGVTFLGATGLGVLAGASVRARQAGGHLVLRDPTPTITRLLEITGLVAFFRLEQTDQLLGAEVA